jgi:bifunctional ADP-heptose synthase (sugar kinase/adenylyltransferase)
MDILINLLLLRVRQVDNTTIKKTRFLASFTDGIRLDEKRTNESEDLALQDLLHRSRKAIEDIKILNSLSAK